MKQRATSAGKQGFISIILLAGVLVVGISLLLIFRSNSPIRLEKVSEVKEVDLHLSSASPTPAIKSEEELRKCIKTNPTPGYDYIVTPLGYYFEYPVNDNCNTTRCFFENSTLDIFNALYVESSLEETLIRSTDYCAADGPTGSLHCDYKGYKEYTSNSGTKGYIIYQTKTDKHLNPEAEKRFSGPPRKLLPSDWIVNVYDDRAYFFFIPNEHYPAIHLQVWKATPDNLAILDRVASTFTIVNCE